MRESPESESTLSPFCSSPCLCVSVVRVFSQSPKERHVIHVRQGKHCLAAVAVGAVGELQDAAVSFGDLAAQNQPDTTAAVLGGEERHEKIVAVEQAGAFVKDEDFNATRVGAPADFNGARMFL